LRTLEQLHAEPGCGCLSAWLLCQFQSADSDSDHHVAACARAVIFFHPSLSSVLMRCLLLVGLAVVAATLLLSGEGRAESTDSSSLRRYQHHHTHHGSSNNNAVVKPFFNDQMRVGLATIVPRARAWAQEFLDSNVRQATSTMTADADAQNQLQPLQFDDVPVPYTLCSGSGGALVTIQSLTSTIWPPKLGSSLTLTGQYHSGGNTSGYKSAVKRSLQRLEFLAVGALWSKKHHSAAPAVLSLSSD
jgi:hypothetical protein